jgi:hypothetical protein
METGTEKESMMPPRYAPLVVRIVSLILISASLAGAQESWQEWSGMYAFLREGEFVQLTIEDQGQVTGLISRYSDAENDKGAFLDQFFKSAKLDGNKLSFTTKMAHGVWFDFKGTIERGAGKNPGDEGYYVLKGTLIENSTDANKKVNVLSQNVVLSMFPQEATGPTGTQRSPKN